MHPVIHSVGDKIKQERKKQRMTQKDLCEGICSQAEISKIENGRNSPTIDLLQQICRRLRIPISLFFEDEIVSQKLNEIDQKMIRHLREKTYSNMENDLKLYKKTNSAVEIQILIRYHQEVLEYERGNIDFRTCIASLLQVVKQEKVEEKSFLLYTRIQMVIAVLYTNHEEYSRAHQIYKALLELSYQTREYKKIRMKIMYNFIRNLVDSERFEEGLQEVQQVIEETKQLQDLTYLGQFYFQKGILLEGLKAPEIVTKEAYTTAYSFFIATENHSYLKILETYFSEHLLFPIDESE
ncbi:helix-turn-helix domain-containing protein [Exiguobacterium sp. SL14]|nr:helix-turn-helix domain-containing protein [Exiguobacterium sp. SL14]MCY1690815.1 helix-turn-helix domain-containing protein [Exiguobacterium sp. SL14]